MIGPEQIQGLITDPKVITFATTIVVVAIGLYINTKIKQNVNNKIAAENIADSTVLAIGVTVRYGTAIGCREGKIGEFREKDVRVDFSATKELRKSSLYIPNEDFLKGYEIVHTDDKKAA